MNQYVFIVNLHPRKGERVNPEESSSSPFSIRKVVSYYCGLSMVLKVDGNINGK